MFYSVSHFSHFSISHIIPGPPVCISHFPHFSLFLTLFQVLQCVCPIFHVFQVSRHNPGPTGNISNYSRFSVFLNIFQVLQCSFLTFHVFECFSPYSRSNCVCVHFFFFFGQFSRDIPGPTVRIAHFSCFLLFIAIFQVLKCAFLIFHVLQCLSPYSRSHSV